MLILDDPCSRQSSPVAQWSLLIFSLGAQYFIALCLAIKWKKCLYINRKVVYIYAVDVFVIYIMVFISYLKMEFG
ncbi:hypothetical protein CW304_19655 [Bacillus sp. UFRGS-B20]|nr:hypothetical protein CW304_19655 [Bacillus sp. UFRGS-B20]